MARSIVSFGMLPALASAIALRKRAFASGSPPPVRAATVSSLINLVKSFPRLASSAPFLCLMECHFECPDIFESVILAQIFYWLFRLPNISQPLYPQAVQSHAGTRSVWCWTSLSLSITKRDKLKEANLIGPPGNQSGLDEFVPPAAEQRSELSPGRVCEPWVTNGNLPELRSGEREPLNAA